MLDLAGLGRVAIDRLGFQIVLRHLERVVADDVLERAQHLGLLPVANPRLAAQKPPSVSS